MKPAAMYAAIGIIVMAGVFAISASKEVKGACFKRYSKSSGCKKFITIDRVSVSSFKDCCSGGGAGWSLTRRDRKRCTSCKAAEPTDFKGVCFNKYSKKSGCRHYVLTNGEKTGTIEECCRGGGSGWSRKKRDRKTCTSCANVDTSFWGLWSEWSKCNAICGQAFQQRQRNCLNTKGKPLNCRGRSRENKRCANLPPCPVDGGWAAWSPWSSCSVSCGMGKKIQKRACDSPKPMHGGKQCQGKFENWANCQEQKDCPVHGGWGKWSSWGKCSKTCDLGTKKRTRKCDSPEPKYGGRECEVNQSVATDYCREERCQPGNTVCDERSEECTSGSGSGWEFNSGSGSESSGSSGFGSGIGSGEGSGGERYRRSKKNRHRVIDDEDYL